jgi:hypothetical protein
VFLFAGSQGGKTVFGPVWLYREILKHGPGDYLAVTATFDLFKLKMLPSLRWLFEHTLRVGRYWAGSKVIELADPETGRFWATQADDMMWGRIILRSAQSKGGLESSTAKAAWLDECGMDDFTVSEWEAVERRLSLFQGRVLGTTTLYNRGWVKSRIYDKWRDGSPLHDVIQFASYINPSYPKDEFDRLVSEWAQWKVNMFLRGEFDKPAGLIYDSFNEEICLIDPFTIPDNWKLYGGSDFGGVNTVGLLYAEDPETQNLYAHKEYKRGGRTAEDHAAELKKWKSGLWVGGSWSEDQWRREFAKGGLPIIKPSIKDVEVGIDRVYAQHKKNAIFVFSNMSGYLDEKRSYSRKLDAEGEPTEEIQDKSTFHFMDAERYIIGKIRPAGGKTEVPEQPEEQSKFSEHDASEGSRWKV